MKNEFMWFVFFIIVCLIFLLIHQHFQETFLENDPFVVRLKNKLLPFFPELSNIVVLKGESSFTLRKYKIHLCTEDENGMLYDDNMMTYVFLHELAHCLNKEVGHGQKFQMIFQNLLDRAEKFGLYDPNIPRVQNYCTKKKFNFKFSKLEF
jgi:hypothetical protein